MNPSIRVVALVGKRPDDMGQEKQEIALSGINGTIVTYDELIDNSRQAYSQYIEASSKASTLNAILTRITDQIDED